MRTENIGLLICLPECTRSFSHCRVSAVEKSGIRIMVGKTVTENIVLKQSALEETITVTGEVPVIDVTDSGLSTNFDIEQINKVPSGRHSVFDIVKQAPGIVMADGYENTPGIIGLGSNDESNSIQMDGLDITSPEAWEPDSFPQSGYHDRSGSAYRRRFCRVRTIHRRCREYRVEIRRK